jgi:pseudouridine kinase
MSYILVIGALNADICGKPEVQLLAGESNIGRVSISLGGVGHNIALNLALLGAETRFITALGGDMYAKEAEREAAEYGLDISNSLICEELPTSTYLCLCDEKGDMAAAVNDMSVINRLTPAFLSLKKEIIENASIVVVDCNLPIESLDYITHTAHGQVFADTVSAAKAEKLKALLGRLHTIKPNRAEACVLSGIEVTDTASAELAARELIKSGLKRVFISLGAEGVYCTDGETGEGFHLQSEVYMPINATGAGDAFLAAAAYASLKGYSLRKTAEAGIAASKQTAMCESTVNVNIKL